MQEFLTPLEKVATDFAQNQIGNHTQFYVDSLPDLTNVDLAFVGACEDRNSIRNIGSADGPNQVRQFLYDLEQGDWDLKFIDLGNISPGNTTQDTYVALGQIVSTLISHGVTPIIIGGSHDLTYGQYLGYANQSQVINMAVIDEMIDIYKRSDDINSSSFLYRIFTESPNYVFNFSQIGYQSYFVSPDDIAVLEKLFFEFYRLGRIRENFEEVEPIIRDADLISFDLSAIRQSDAPGKMDASPNGFFGEEACRIARYAGITDKVSSFGIYELNPLADLNNQTSHLVAQMIWYFMDGYYSRKNEYPKIDETNFFKYIVSFAEISDDITFWKSKKSGRWWMEVASSKDLSVPRHQLVPCSYQDYQRACSEEIPERWLRAYEKLAT